MASMFSTPTPARPPAAPPADDSEARAEAREQARQTAIAEQKSRGQAITKAAGSTIALQNRQDKLSGVGASNKLGLRVV